MTTSKEQVFAPTANMDENMESLKQSISDLYARIRALEKRIIELEAK